MIFIMENWRGYLNEEGSLDEGLGDWWAAIKNDALAVLQGATPDSTIGMVMNKVRNTDNMKNLKGEALVKFLISLKAAAPKHHQGKGPVSLNTPAGESAVKGRQLDNFINYAKQNPEETLEDIIANAPIKHARDPDLKLALTQPGDLAKLAGIFSVIAGTLAVQQVLPGKRDDMREEHNRA